MDDQYFGLSVDRLPLDHHVDHPILNRDLEPLAPAGQRIDRDVVQRLRLDGNDQVFVHLEDRKRWGLSLVFAKTPSGRPAIMPTRKTFSADSMANVAPELVEHVQEILASPDPGATDDRREEARYSIAAPVPVQELTDHMTPLGRPYLAVLRDVSSKGLSIYHVKDVVVRHFLVEVEMKGETQQLLAETVRCRRTGKFHEVGGKFVAKLS
ncbi:hypothetical protein Pan216_51400 [Planctomycetes bacterium Pan216]|uniref:PilZ domain-containing protein n=2 Tax=Kolteria novifilia TaxID=2527975 RepID=A0A518BB94_9BACT|nr:hypothetical protein Pan216_51400 [Planctomycetes bacterium Pan216]